MTNAKHTPGWVMAPAKPTPEMLDGLALRFLTWRRTGTARSIRNLLKDFGPSRWLEEQVVENALGWEGFMVGEKNLLMLAYKAMLADAPRVQGRPDDLLAALEKINERAKRAIIQPQFAREEAQQIHTEARAAIAAATSSASP